jgi:hypothetical protein
LRAGLPDRHLPPSGFLTLSTVSPHPGLVALFHATSAPGILAFRAFPTRSAVTPLGALGSLAVRLAPPLTSERPGSPQLDRASTSSKAGPTPASCNPEGAPTTSAASRRKQATNTMRRAVATSSEACLHNADEGCSRLGQGPLEAGSGRREPRLQSVAPTERPFSSQGR